MLARFISASAHGAGRCLVARVQVDVGAVGGQQAADARQVAAERQHPLRRNRNLLGLVGEIQQRQRLVGLQADEAGFFITGDADLLLVAWPQLAGTFEGDQRLIELEQRLPLIAGQSGPLQLGVGEGGAVVGITGFGTILIGKFAAATL